MKTIMELLVAFAGGAVGGFAAVRVSLWHRDRRERASSAVHDAVLDPVVEENIDEVARTLAHSRGRPDAQRLIANKLRLAVRLRDRHLREYGP